MGMNGLRRLFLNMIRKVNAEFRAYRMLVAFDGSYLHSSGWMESLRKGHPCDENGNPLPWMNYPVISLLEERLQKEHILFEYGCGHSTGWYSERVKSVDAVESDNRWYRRILNQLPDNANLILSEGGCEDYSSTISRTGKLYDIVIVDGEERVRSIVYAIQYLTKRGVIILDDSDRPEYREGHLFAYAHGYRSLTLSGIKPLLRKGFSTTIFYKDGNCFGL